MKIAICAQTNDVQAAVDSRFGRAAFFAVYDDAAQTWEFIPNRQNLQAAQGAGLQSAQLLVDADIQVLLACNVGPKAMAALTGSGIRVFQAARGQTLQQALAAYQSNKLTAVDQATVNGHWV